MAINIPWLNKSKSNVGRVGLSVGPDGLSVACVNAEGAIVYCHAYGLVDDLDHVLAELIEQQSWVDMPCSVVLHPVYYQMLLAEAPPVEESEMSSAVRWRIKDLLDYPLEEAAIEHLLLPDDAYRGRQKMLYAATIRKSTLQSLIEPIVACGLDVDCIEIAELAMNNLLVRQHKEPGGAALVHLLAGEGLINLTEGGSVYLCRRLDIGSEKYAEGGDNAVFLENLLLEVQRSLDFYESQLGKGIITHVYGAPVKGTDIAGEFISTQLGLTVVPLYLGDLSATSVDVAEAAECMLAIGAAMGPIAVEAVESSVATH